MQNIRCLGPLASVYLKFGHPSPCVVKLQYRVRGGAWDGGGGSVFAVKCHGYYHRTSPATILFKLALGLAVKVHVSYLLKRLKATYCAPELC